MSEREQKLRAIAALLIEAAETGRPLQHANRDAGTFVPSLLSELSEWRVAPPPPKKVIDLSRLVESGIDCEFWDLVGGKTISVLTDIHSMTYERETGQWNSHCRPRMNHNHFHGGNSDKCPVPEGFTVMVMYRDKSRAKFQISDMHDLDWCHNKVKDTDIIAFRIIGVTDGYCMPWEVES